MNLIELLQMISIKDQHQHIALMFDYSMNLIYMMDYVDQLFDHQVPVTNHLYLENLIIHILDNDIYMTNPVNQIISDESFSKYDLHFR